VTAVKFYSTFTLNPTHSSNSILTVVLSSGAFYMYDVKEKKVTEWIEEVGGRVENVVPKGMGKGEGRDVVWLEGNKFALVSDRELLYVVCVVVVCPVVCPVVCLVVCPPPVAHARCSGAFP